MAWDEMRWAGMGWDGMAGWDEMRMRRRKRRRRRSGKSLHIPHLPIARPSGNYVNIIILVTL